MTGDSRQQRRRLVRERQKAGERALARGLQATPGRSDIVAVAEVLRAKLAEAGNDRRAGQAAALAHQLAERSLAANPARGAIACTRGCSYCCHGFVGVLPAEAFLVADAVRGGRAGSLDADTVRARSVPLRGLSPDARIGRKLACPLLADGLCGVYAVRPLVCRQTTSLSLPACIEEFEGHDRGGRIEISGIHLAHSSNAHVTLLGALEAQRMPTAAYELGAALEVALADPSAERRWLAGEDVFAALAGATVERPPEVALVARAIARELGA